MNVLFKKEFPSDRLRLEEESKRISTVRNRLMLNGNKGDIILINASSNLKNSEGWAVSKINNKFMNDKDVK